MKIVDRQTFLAMPAETVFSKYTPSMFEGLNVKGDTIYSEGRAIDFFYQDIGADAIEVRDSGEWGAKLDLSEQTGCELAMDFECQGRDGCFDDDQLFAVFSKADVAALMERLKRCL
jgi:hypothetical protein